MVDEVWIVTCGPRPDKASLRVPAQHLQLLYQPPLEQQQQEPHCLKLREQLLVPHLQQY